VRELGSEEVRELGTREVSKRRRECGDRDGSTVNENALDRGKPVTR
jgi:hypothetical protein